MIKKSSILFAFILLYYVNSAQQCAFTLGSGYAVIKNANELTSAYPGTTKFYLCTGGSLIDDIGVDTVAMLTGTNFTSTIGNVKILMKGNAMCDQNGTGDYFWRELTTTIYNPPLGDVFCNTLLLQNAPSCSTVTTSVKELIYENNINIYPNPATDFITFSFNINTITPRSIKIYDITGTMAQEVFLNEGVEKIKIEHLSAGIYLYRIQDNLNNFSVGKFVVNE